MSWLLIVLIFVVLGLGVVLVAMRSGSSGPVLDSNKRGSRRAVAVFTALAVAVFAVAIPVIVALADNSTAEEDAGPVTLTASEQHGRQLFSDHCVQCHTLGASNAVQTIGPNLDVLRPPKALVLDAIKNGRARGNGQMPAGLYNGPDAQDVAAYVAAVAGRN